MKKDEIEVNGLYSDGKKSLRRVVDAGPHYQFREGQSRTDCILYELIAGTAGGKPVRGTSVNGFPLLWCTRVTFAGWARRRLDSPERALLNQRQA